MTGEHAMPDERDQFINAMGDILSSWNLSRATGRTYGYLLVRGEPSSSDDIRATLGLSAGAVSASMRELVSWGLARTIPQPGSRRLLIEATGGFEQLLAASQERSRAFIRILRSGRNLTEDACAADRFDAVTHLFETYVEAGERVLRERGGAIGEP